MTTGSRIHRTTRRGRWRQVAATVIVLAVGPLALHSAQAVDRWDVSAYVTHRATSWLATDDAYTVSTMPDRRTGHSPKIAVGRDGRDYKAGYLRFETGTDLTGTAELTLTIMSGEPGTLQLHATDAGWTESRLTAANAPEPGEIIATVPVRGGWERLTIDLGDHVTTPGAYAFALTRPEQTGVVRVASSERGIGLGPLLRAAAGAPFVPPMAAPTAPAPTGSPEPTEPAQPTEPPEPTEPAQPTEPPEPTEPAQPTEPAEPPAPPTPGLPQPSCTVSEILVPSCGHWFGVGAVPVGDESWYEAIDLFEETIERQVDIVHFYRRGQDRVFPTPQELEYVTGPDGDRILFFNWRTDRLTWREVADGAADDYLIRLAEHMVEVHPEPFFLSLHAEMESEVDATPGSGQTAEDFRDFFRHTIELLRSNGASQIITVVNYMGAPHWTDQPWFEELYPGDDVVDWIAQDPYSFGQPPVFRTDLAGLINRPHFRSGSTWPGFYTWATRNFPDKPMMLAEWGVDEFDDDPDFKPMFFRTAASQLRAFPAIKALVYWNAPDSRLAGETRVDSSPESLEAAREFVDHPLLRLAGDVTLRDALAGEEEAEDLPPTP